VPELLKGDPSRLAQILINLAGNSIKFTDKGFVEIKCVINSFSNNTYDTEFSITDTGIGIAKDKIQSIFESFTQADSDTSRKYGGTGLGLTICKQLTELQGGRISLESKLGTGTRFFFNIPYPASDGKKIQSAEQIQKESQVNLNGIRILMVEDNEFNKIVAEDTILERIPDVHIEHASNGVEALEKMEASDLAQVLMDIQMPEMDGYESTRRIRQMDIKKETQVMAMTPNANP
jgi:hypothetical protein